MGAKETSRIIPLCHNIPIDSVNVEITKNAKMNSLKVYAKVQTSSKTGVEMEALTAVTVSCLTIYDMCKYLNKSIKIKNIKLVSKKGGKSANFRV
jgi:cyclic pyranopterin phosphate synthase